MARPKKEEVKTDETKEEVKESKENQVEQKPMNITHEGLKDNKPFEMTEERLNAHIANREKKQKTNEFLLAMECSKIIPFQIKEFKDKKTGEVKEYDSYQAEFSNIRVGNFTLSLSKEQHSILEPDTWYFLSGCLIGKGDMNNLALDRVKDCSLEKINF